MKPIYVYIMASKKNGVLYVGYTTSISRRTLEHKTCINKCFTSKYKVFKLVYVEEHKTVREALTRERQMKEWKREWKIKLIEANNPEWNDLYDSP